MFEISHKLNKQAKASVFFVDKNFKFNNQNNYFLKSELNQLYLFKESLKDKEVLALDLISNNKKTKVIICKIKDNPSEYDSQKVGGTVFDLIKNYDNVNILVESEAHISKNSFLFSTNFVLGLYSKSYVFENYKLNKKKIIIFV